MLISFFGPELEMQIESERCVWGGSRQRAGVKWLPETARPKLLGVTEELVAGRGLAAGAGALGHCHGRCLQGATGNLKF